MPSGSVAHAAEGGDRSIDEAQAEELPTLTVRLRVNGEDRS
jgi:hypothetical protein